MAGDGQEPGRTPGGAPRRRAARPSGADAVRAGATRASGERAHRRARTTPLLADLEPLRPQDAPLSGLNGVNGVNGHDGPNGHPLDGLAGSTSAAPQPDSSDAASAAPASTASERKSAARKAPERKVLEGKAPARKAPERKAPARKAPSRTATTGKAAARSVRLVPDPPAASSTPSGARRTPPPRPAPRLRVVERPPATAQEPPGPGGVAGLLGRLAALVTAGGGQALAAAGEQAARLVVDALVSGQAPDQVEERVADLLALLRRRLTGDFAVDEFGFDPELTDTVLLAVLRPLYRRWFRVEVRGIENIPAEGGALVVANHSGAIALDSLMTQVAIHDEHPARRHLRMLGADLVFATPVLAELARKGGATLASNADAERLLSAGEVVGVWPEGFKGIGKPFSERYKLQRFGRGGFVSAALRTRTPIVPCAIVGAEETYPIIGNMPTVARLLGLPYAPVTPTWPWLGPLGLVPLPSKWLIEFGAPVPTDTLGDGAAEDPMLVFDLTDQVRQTIQQTLYSLLVQRRSVFF